MGAAGGTGAAAGGTGAAEVERPAAAAEAERPAAAAAAEAERPAAAAEAERPAAAAEAERPAAAAEAERPAAAAEAERPAAVLPRLHQHLAVPSRLRQRSKPRIEPAPARERTAIIVCPTCAHLTEKMLSQRSSHKSVDAPLLNDAVEASVVVVVALRATAER
jgi:hypothetical protein